MKPSLITTTTLSLAFVLLARTANGAPAETSLSSSPSDIPPHNNNDAGENIIENALKERLVPLEGHGSAQDLTIYPRGLGEGVDLWRAGDEDEEEEKEEEEDHQSIMHHKERLETPRIHTKNPHTRRTVRILADEPQVEKDVSALIPICGGVVAALANLPKSNEKSAHFRQAGGIKGMLETLIAKLEQDKQKKRGEEVTPLTPREAKRLENVKKYFLKSGKGVAVGALLASAGCPLLYHGWKWAHGNS